MGAARPESGAGRPPRSRDGGRTAGEGRVRLGQTGRPSGRDGSGQTRTASPRVDDGVTVVDTGADDADAGRGELRQAAADEVYAAAGRSVADPFANRARPRVRSASWTTRVTLARALFDAPHQLFVPSMSAAGLAPAGNVGRLLVPRRGHADRNVLATRTIEEIRVDLSRGAPPAGSWSPRRWIEECDGRVSACFDEPY